MKINLILCKKSIKFLGRKRELMFIKIKRQGKPAGVGLPVALL
jgi:hypothetical protein